MLKTCREADPKQTEQLLHQESLVFTCMDCVQVCDRSVVSLDLLFLSVCFFFSLSLSQAMSTFKDQSDYLSLCRDISLPLSLSPSLTLSLSLPLSVCMPHTIQRKREWLPLLTIQLAYRAHCLPFLAHPATQAVLARDWNTAAIHTGYSKFQVPACSLFNSVSIARRPPTVSLYCYSRCT